MAIILSSCVSFPDIPGHCRELDYRVTEAPDDFGIPVKTVHPNPVCMKEIGEIECGFCTWTISNRTQYVGEDKKFHLYGKPWSQIREESLMVPSESAAKIKAFVVKVCHDNKTLKGCDEVSKWRLKLDAADSIGGAFDGDYKLAPHLNL